jgi:hypothetical protein
MPSYSEVQKAVRVEKLRIWFGWLAGNVLVLVIASGTQNIAVVSVITQVMLVVVFVALAVALFRMTGALNREAAAGSAGRRLPVDAPPRTRVARARPSHCSPVMEKLARKDDLDGYQADESTAPDQQKPSSQGPGKPRPRRRLGPTRKSAGQEVSSPSR